MVAGLGIADLRQVGEGADGHLLDQIVFGHPPGHLGFQGCILVLQAVAGLFGFQLGAHPGLNDDGLDGLGDVVDGAKERPNSSLWGSARAVSRTTGMVLPPGTGAVV